MRVLYAEDDEIDRHGLVRLVRQQGLAWDLILADSHRKALRRVERLGACFDVAILDDRLGDGRGLDLIAHLGPTPAIVVTGQGSEEVADPAAVRSPSRFGYAGVPVFRSRRVRTPSSGGPGLF